MTRVECELIGISLFHLSSAFYRAKEKKVVELTTNWSSIEVIELWSGGRILWLEEERVVIETRILFFFWTIFQRNCQEKGVKNW